MLFNVPCVLIGREREKDLETRLHFPSKRIKSLLPWKLGGATKATTEKLAKTCCAYVLTVPQHVP